MPAARATLLLLLGVVVVPAAAQRPNIIHVVADDLGWTDLSTGLTNYGAGSGFHETPNIDRLASEGMAFTSAYAQQTCVPTRVAYMTGQHPQRTDVYNVQSIEGDADSVLVPPSNATTIPIAATTIGETLQAAGYTTAHFGKFHVAQRATDIVNQHGYGSDFGGGTTGAPMTFFSSNGQFDTRVGAGLDPYAATYTQAYVDEHLKPFANGADVDSLVGTEKHLSDAMADAAIDFMQGQLAAPGGEPFYMNVAFHAVHTPIESRPDLEAKYNGILAANGGASPDPRHDNAAYAGLIEGMDQAIGRITAFLEDPNGDGDTVDSIASNTVVLFYGDNGGTSVSDNTPLSGRKDSQQEGGLRVPLIAWSPGQVAAGSSSDEPVHAVDFYPTFAEWADADLPDPATHALDGQSIAPLLAGVTTKVDRDGVFFHYPGYTANETPVSTVVLDAGGTRHKLMYFYETAEYQLYDLNADIGEANDLANGNQTAHEYKLAARGARALREWLVDTEADLPTVRSTGEAVPLPAHLPALTITPGADLDGLASAEVEELGVHVTLGAAGAPGATLVADGGTLGVSSSLDTGVQNQQGRINGSLTTPEAIEFSFDHDVYLKSLLLGALNVAAGEGVLLEFVSGDNPFLGLNGYNAADGFTMTSDSLLFDAANADGTEHLLRFGGAGRDEVFLTAGTVLSLTADPATGGGLLLSGLTFAQPLSAVDSILLDYELDGQIDTADYQLWKASFGSTTDLRADGNGDGVVNAADFTLWRDSFLTSATAGAAAAPEPTAASLLFVAGAALASVRRTAR